MTSPGMRWFGMFSRDRYANLKIDFIEVQHQFINLSWLSPNETPRLKQNIVKKEWLLAQHKDPVEIWLLLRHGCLRDTNKETLDTRLFNMHSLIWFCLSLGQLRTSFHTKPLNSKYLKVFSCSHFFSLFKKIFDMAGCGLSFELGRFSD